METTTTVEQITTEQFNLLPNELQVEIINNMTLDELREVFMYIEDSRVREYASRMGEILAQEAREARRQGYTGLRLADGKFRIRTNDDIRGPRLKHRGRVCLTIGKDELRRIAYDLGIFESYDDTAMFKRPVLCRMIEEQMRKLGMIIEDDR